jgi:hypothetical protein
LSCSARRSWPGSPATSANEELAAPVVGTLDDYDEVLRPDWVVGEPSQVDGPLKAQLLVQGLPKGADGRRCWETAPQQRLERLIKESDHQIGLLWNGVALRPLMEQSRKEQNEVSTRLAEQVLEALWILLRGFDAAAETRGCR